MTKRSKSPSTRQKKAKRLTLSKKTLRDLTPKQGPVGGRGVARGEGYCTYQVSAC
jgi:hypothetical protein